MRTVSENEKERGIVEENKIPAIKDSAKKRKGKDIAKK
jgi:hypothetical protein